MKPEYQEWLEKISQLLDNPSYSWAEDTLLGIGETIEISEKITDGQKEAIQNIEKSAR